MRSTKKPLTRVTTILILVLVLEILVLLILELWLRMISLLPLVILIFFGVPLFVLRLTIKCKNMENYKVNKLSRKRVSDRKLTIIAILITLIGIVIGCCVTIFQNTINDWIFPMDNPISNLFGICFVSIWLSLFIWLIYVCYRGKINNLGDLNIILFILLLSLGVLALEMYIFVFLLALIFSVVGASELLNELVGIIPIAISIVLLWYIFKSIRLHVSLKANTKEFENSLFRKELMGG